MSITVTILSFSARNNGNCAAISDFLQHYYERTNVHCFVIDDSNFAPCGKCDYECLKQGQSCPQLTIAQKEVMDSICESNIVYFIVPNYCGYPCANYFAFNERSVGYFNMDEKQMERYMSVTKRFIVISNTQNNNFMDAMQQQTSEKPDILYLQSSKYHKRSIAGDLLDCEAAKDDLKAFLALGFL